MEGGYSGSGRPGEVLEAQGTGYQVLGFTLPVLNVIKGETLDNFFVSGSELSK